MTWEFKQEIAKTFVNHARQHIPNYDLVIDKCISLCKYYLENDSSIIDVGCATGETLRRLHQAGFDNLTGVESSIDMLKHCDYNIAKLLHDNNFPNKIFNGVLCNWTLHFIKDKINYLTNIYKNLEKKGFLILSEKTSLDPVAINFYHNWKHNQGVSWDDINAKEKAIKDVMFINNPQWYLHNLTQVGFKNVQIIDATWCFTTFIGIK